MSEVFLKGNVPTEIPAGLRVSNAFAQYVDIFRMLEYDNRKITIVATLTGKPFYTVPNSADHLLRRNTKSRKAEKHSNNHCLEYRMIIFSRLGEISKLLSSEYKYAGVPTEPIKRRCYIFLNACHLCVVETL